MRSEIEALRAPLLAAAADAARRAEGEALGADLRAACDRALRALPDEERPPFEAWRLRLDGFEALGSTERTIEIQRGLRLCQTVAGAARRRSRRERPAEGLCAPADALPGVGPATAEKLAARGLETVEDLARLIPNRYDDLRSIPPIADALDSAVDGERVALWGRVHSCRVARRGARRWIDLRLGGGAEGASGPAVAVRFFNVPPGMASRFSRGAPIALGGGIARRRGAWEMANPEVLAVGEPGGELPSAAAQPEIRPRYPDIPGVGAAALRRACRAAAERARAELPEAVPPAAAARHGLPGLGEALAVLHAPPPSLSEDDARALFAGESRWHKRLAFEELFVLGVAVALRRRARGSGTAPRCPEPSDPRGALSRALPFSLTSAQERAIEVIGGDMARARPMCRLLHGDVGSGKTAVAFAAARQAIASGRQVALMAPTEMLARQHARTLAPWCRALGVSCASITAATPRAERRSTEARLAAGRVDLAIGTHALLAEGVCFHALGLAIVDEQHRFGVAQRARLRDKGEGEVPHLLVMTATPIPRTLALTAYGDLDVTALDELPPGREPPVTRALAGEEARRRVYERLRERLRGGARAFVVCPLVEAGEGDDSGAADAVSVHRELSEILAPAKVGLVHGRMDEGAREREMEALARGELSAVVATTVIEVGVDIPEANVLVVEDADRFGAAQLHQLRGRVGRGGGEAYCVLLTRGEASSAGARRLEILTRTSDGFQIAEEDLALRGPGEVFGARQAGLPRHRFGDARRYEALLERAREEAEALLDADPDLEAPELEPLRRALGARAHESRIFGPDSG